MDTEKRPRGLAHDLVLPTIMFAALGGMSWAVRGSSGYGAVKGCIFAGVLWGAAWWFLARDPSRSQTRRYASGWIVLALTLGIGLAGGRGWMQWPSFFLGELTTNYAAGEFVEIPRWYGFAWLFLAGVPWAGLGACALVWCAYGAPLRAWQWAVRIASGFGGAYLALLLYREYPQYFLPLYRSIEDLYNDAEANPTLQRLVNDNRNAVRHLGFYLGFLSFEFFRRDWRNAVLILVVGVVNGIGWALFQNWQWTQWVWPDSSFNFWRCWESSGGISIGIAYGLAYYAVNRPLSEEQRAQLNAPPAGRALWLDVIGVMGLAVILAWLIFAKWRDAFEGSYWPQLAFGAMLLYGILLYLSRIVAGLQRTTYEAYAAGEDAGGTHPLDPIPSDRGGLRGFSARDRAAQSAYGQLNLEWWLGFGMMLLIGWFMMTQLTSGWRGTMEQPWWSRLGEMYFGITILYGLAYIIEHFVRHRGRLIEGAPVSSSQGLRHLDWLVIGLSLLLIVGRFLRGEIPDWRGWFGFELEERQLWTAYLYIWIVGAFALIYYFVSLWQSSNGDEYDAADFDEEPNLERLGVYLGLLLGLGLSIKNGTRGWANIYWIEYNTEEYWGDLFWQYVGPAMLIVLVLVLPLVLFRRFPAGWPRDVFPHAYWLLWLVLIVQNVLGQMITGPLSHWNEFIFNLYYVNLFLVTGIIAYHYHVINRLTCGRHSDAPDAMADDGMSHYATPAHSARPVLDDEPWER